MPSSSTRAWILRPLSSVALPLKWISASVLTSSAEESFEASVDFFNLSLFPSTPVTMCLMSSSRMPPTTDSK